MADETLQEAIEKAVRDDVPVWLDFAKAEPVRATMISNTKFVIEGAYWKDQEGNVCQPVIEAQHRSNMRVAAMYVVGNVALDGASSADTRMFRPENRCRGGLAMKVKVRRVTAPYQDAPTASLQAILRNHAHDRLQVCTRQLYEIMGELARRREATGTPLTPSFHGKDCLGNGEHPGIECRCDECDHYLACFPDWKEHS